MRKITGLGIPAADARGESLRASRPGLRGLGRDAIPALVSELRRGPPWSEKSGLSPRTQLALDTLIEQLEPSDLELAIGLLQEGRIGLARLVRGRHDARWRAALLDVLRRGFMSMDLAAALAEHSDHEEVHMALLAWCMQEGDAQHGGVHERDEILDSIASVIGTPQPRDAGPGEPRRLLRSDALEKDLPLDVRWRIARDAAAAGVQDGLELLVACAGRHAELSTDSRDLLAREVNRLTNARLFDVSAERVRRVHHDFSGVSGDIPAVVRENSPMFRTAPPASRAYAAPGSAAFRAWWEMHRPRLEYDATTRSWNPRAN